MYLSSRLVLTFFFTVCSALFPSVVIKNQFSAHLDCCSLTVTGVGLTCFILRLKGSQKK